MDSNLIISRQEAEGRTIVLAGGIDMGTVDGLQLALNMARMAAEYLADLLIEAKVTAKAAPKETGDGNG